VDRERPYPEQIDRLLNWPLGTAARLARRGKLPHFRLPDGSFRFDRAEVESLIVHVDAMPASDSEATPAARALIAQSRRGRNCSPAADADAARREAPE
jgi:hypothetical protein